MQKNVGEYIKNLYNTCLENGIYLKDFEEYSIDEVLDYMKAYQNKINNQVRLNNVFAYNIGHLVAYAFHEPNKYPNYYEFFGEKQPEQEDNSWKEMYKNLVNYDIKRREFIKEQNKISETS